MPPKPQRKDRTLSPLQRIQQKLSKAQATAVRMQPDVEAATRKLKLALADAAWSRGQMLKLKAEHAAERTRIEEEAAALIHEMADKIAAAEGKLSILNLLCKKAEIDLTESAEAEQAIWQETMGAVYRSSLPPGMADYEVDGAGCDSGDPLDLTRTELGMVLRGWEDAFEGEHTARVTAEKEAEEAKAQLAKLADRADLLRRLERERADRVEGQKLLAQSRKEQCVRRFCDRRERLEAKEVAP